MSENIITEITSILATDGDSWKFRWVSCTNSMDDVYGNTVTITEDDETVRIEFEYALGGIVETMHLNPQHGARRIAAIIEALAAPLQ